MEQQISKILEQWQKSFVNIRSLQKLEGGYVNTVFLAKFTLQSSANEVEVIVRTRVDEEEDINEVFSEYSKEGWCIKRAGEAGIPIPEVFEIGKFESLPFMIQKKVAGIRGVEFVAQNPNKNKFCWEKLGQYARQLQSIPTEGFGTKFNEATHTFYDRQTSYLSFIDYNISSLMDDEDKLATKKYITKEQAIFLKSVFVDLRRKTEYGKFKFGLVHGDLSLRNLMVDNNDTYLLDWGCACVGVIPHLEIITVLRHVMNFGSKSESYEAFITGLGISQTEYENMKPDLYAMLLLSCSDMVRWAIDSCTDAIDHEVEISFMIIF